MIFQILLILPIQNIHLLRSPLGHEFSSYTGSEVTSRVVGSLSNSFSESIINMYFYITIIE